MDTEVSVFIMKFFSAKNRGFTLIELLVVISIIAVLSSVILAALNGSRNKATLSKLYQTMVSVNEAAFSCVSGGGTLQTPNSNSIGGTSICSGGTTMLPDITFSGFTYCGNSCGGWTQNGQVYGISVYDPNPNSYGSNYLVVVCGASFNASDNGWYGLSGLNLGNNIGCVKSGF